MAQLKIDIVDGADFRMVRRDDGGIVKSGTRVAHVRGFTGETDAGRALSYCMTVVAATHPLGSAYSPEHQDCVCNSQTAEGIFDDVARIRLGYQTPQVQGGDINNGGTVWRVSGTSRTVSTMTELELGTRNTILVKYTNPDNAADNFGPGRVARVQDREVHYGFSVQGVTTPAKARELMNYSGHVNLNPWGGKGIGYWLIDNTSFDEALGATFATFQCDVLTRGKRDWGEIALAVSTMTGKPLPIPDNVVDRLMNTPYDNSQRQENGATKVGTLPLADFQQLFGVGGF